MIELILSYLDDILILAGLLVASLFLSVVVRRMVRAWLLRVAPGVAGFFATLAQISVVLLGFVAAVWFSGISGAVLLTVVAILSAGVSLALDHSVQDAIAGVKILVFGYVKGGDHVRLLGGHEGEVISLDLFTVTLRTRERDAVIIPNREVVGTVVINKTMITGQVVDGIIPIRRPYDRAVAQATMVLVAESVDHDYGDHVFDPEVRLLAVEDIDRWRLRVYVSDEMSLSRVRHVILTRASVKLEESGLVLGGGLDVRMEKDRPALGGIRGAPSSGTDVHPQVMPIPEFLQAPGRAGDV